MTSQDNPIFDPIELIIFDCDGVLVDSEILYARVELESLQAEGIEITLDQLHNNYSGLSYDVMLQRIADHHQVTFPDHYGADHPERLDRLFETELKAIPGMHDLLAAIRGPKCVASNSKLSRVRKSLGITELDHHFGEHLFTAEMVGRPKPAPDLFLHAAGSLGVSPEQCLVIEDSTHGVHAARQAGMRAIGLAAASHCGENHPEKLTGAGASMVASSTEQVARFLNERNLIAA